MNLEVLSDRLHLCTPPPSMQNELAALTSGRWPVGTVLHVRFLDGSRKVWDRIERITNGPDGWNSICGIKFIFDQSPQAQVRVTFAPGGSWSYTGSCILGMPQSSPTMQLGWITDRTGDEELTRIWDHESGHTISLIHEHQQPNANIPWNRQACYEYYARQGWSRDTVDRAVFAKFDASLVVAGPYDPDSIMGYDINDSLVLDPAFAHRGALIPSREDRRRALGWYPRPALDQHVYLPYVHR